MTKIVNLINDAEPKEFAERLIDRSATRNPHIHAWLRTTYMRWLRKQPEHQHLVITGQMRQALIEAKWLDPASQVVTLHADNITRAGSWAVRALMLGHLHMFVVADESTSPEYLHMVDYLGTLPDNKPINKSVEQVKKEIEAWDIKLRNQKLLGDLNSAGAVEVWADPTGKYRICRIESAEAFAAEASYMGNCLVSNGFSTATGLAIYSLRDVATSMPVANLRVDECTFRDTVRAPVVGNAPRITQPGLIRRILNASREQRFLVSSQQETGLERISNPDARPADEWTKGFALINIDGRFNKSITDEMRLAVYVWFEEAFGDIGVNRLTGFDRFTGKHPKTIRSDARFIKDDGDDEDEDEDEDEAENPDDGDADEDPDEDADEDEDDEDDWSEALD